MSSDIVSLSAPGSSNEVLIRAESLWDGTGKPALRDGAVLIRGGRIAGVGSHIAVAAQAINGGERLSFPGHTLIPGLIDCHVHLCFPGDGTLAHDFILGSTRERILLTAARNARAALAHGITTVRDTGSKGRLVLELRDAIESGIIEGSRIIASGPPITATGGHMWYLSNSDLRGEADEESELRVVARNHWKSGVDFFKVVGNGGDTPRTSPYRAQYTTNQLAVIVQAANEHETHVTVHANHLETIRRAVEAGVHMLEHCTFLNEPGTVRFDQELAEAISRRGIIVSHTLQASYWTVRDGRAAWSTLSEPQRSYVQERDRVTQAQIENLGRLHSLGVRVVAATDAGWRKNRIGLDYPIGLELSIQGGLSPDEALLSGTRDAANAIGLGDQLGTLEVGKWADLLLVEGDPLVEINAIRRVRHVMKAGKWYAAATRADG